MYTAAQILDNGGTAVASTSETSLGKINIPMGRTYQITGLWCGTNNAGGGTFRMASDIYPQANFTYVQNSPSDISLGTATANSSISPVNITITGPAEFEGFVTNLSATSGRSAIMIQYIDNAAATN